MVSSPFVRTVTSGSNSGWLVIIGGGGGTSSSGTVPGGFGRSVDCAAAASATLAAMAARIARGRRYDVAADMGASIRDAKSISLERELGLAFGRAGLEAARLVVIEDRLHHRLRLVDHADEVRIVHADHALLLERAADPLEEPAPERAAHQDHGDLPDLPRLHEREDLHQLVQRAESARHHDERARELHEHDLAREEMLERVRDVLELV